MTHHWAKCTDERVPQEIRDEVDVCSQCGMERWFSRPRRRWLQRLPNGVEPEDYEKCDPAWRLERIK